jgi:hypothetical protein
MYPRLEGARQEGIAVAERLGEAGSGIAADKVHALVDQNDAQTIINALFERRYRVVHIAGHGAIPAPDPATPKPAPGSAPPAGGVVLSEENTYLGANEVRAMRTIPELVFLNCCHLAGRDAATTLKDYDRAAFAANIAEELIRAGVRCVIAAGWAVEDKPAEKFATAFYASLLGGARFIEAVGVARAAAWNANRQGTTWAAYQCYGDPEWTWRRAGADAQASAPSPGDEFGGVASPVALVVALETLAIESEYSRPDAGRQLDKLRYLEAEFKPLWGGMGAVAEAFGVAYAAVGAFDQAIAWFQSAVDAQDASASFRAAEQLGNQMVRRAAKLPDVRASRAGIRAGIARLEALAAVQSTIERENLLGSAYKRLSMIEWETERQAEAKAALAASVRHYGEAEAMARKAGTDNLHYPAKNCIGAELRAAFLDQRDPAIGTDRLKYVEDSLDHAATNRPDFWSVVGQTELKMLGALAQGRLAAVEPALSANLRDLKARVPAPRMWDSVLNEAMFTLVPYQAVARTAEKQAAQRLLETLTALAKT